MYELAGNLTIIFHFVIIVFVIFGAFLMVLSKKIVWIHIPTVIYVVYLELTNTICPLTYLENWFLNKANLQDISMKSSGKFHYIDELSEYVKSIKPHHVISRTIDRLKIFNFQAFWFLVLVLLAIEWIIRKNKGLLW